MEGWVDGGKMDDWWIVEKWMDGGEMDGWW